VPKGALAKGEALSKGVEGKTFACAICHGPGLHGLAGIPALAGRTPNYLVRQLFMFQDGERAGSQSPLMAQVVAKMSVEDMLNLAAYISSLDP
jgi:cytochrome c553